MPDISPRLNSLLAYVRSGEPDLTNRQMATLLVVAETPGPHTVRDMAKALGCSKPVVTRLLNTLSTLGFLERERDPDDGRNIFIVMPDEGRRFLERIGNA